MSNCISLGRHIVKVEEIILLNPFLTDSGFLRLFSLDGRDIHTAYILHQVNIAILCTLFMLLIFIAIVKVLTRV